MASHSNYELKSVKEALDDVLRLERLASGSARLGDAEAEKAFNAKRRCGYSFCSKEGTRFCTRCSAAYYCSADCQLKDWTGEGTFLGSPGPGPRKLAPTGHKAVCAKLAKAKAEAASAH